jgi:methionyl-tRNA formyltransferase
MKSGVARENIKRAVFLGSKNLGFGVLKALLEITPNIKWTIIHPDDRSDGRSVLPRFNQLAEAHNADIEICSSARAASSIIGDIKPDIGCVCGWYWLLDAATLDLVNAGLWGIHNSLLPKYRGGAPLVWSIINGDSVVGSTVFRINAGMDDGPVLHRVRINLHQEQSVADALDLIEKRLVIELPAKWVQLMQGSAVVESQCEGDASYCGQRTEADGAIDWRANALRVHNFIRAQVPPYPGAFTYWHAEKVIILRSKAVSGTYFGTPAQVLQRRDRSVFVSCGENTAIEILSVYTEGRERDASTLVDSVRARFADHVIENPCR